MRPRHGQRQKLLHAWHRPQPASASSRLAARLWAGMVLALGSVLAAVNRRLPGARRSPAHLVLGQRGEDLVYWHLQGRGWKVLARRWRSPHEHGDLDLVAMEDSTLSFIEVKTRSSRGWIPALLSVHAGKRRMLRHMARLYLRSIPSALRPQKTRFDIAEVYLLPDGNPTIELRRNAFGWTDRRRPHRYRD